MAFLDTTTNQLYGLVAAALFLVGVAVFRHLRPSLKGIRGPPRSSFWLGNQGDFRYQEEVGDVEFSWLREYGGAWKLHGPLGQEQLVLADPKALQYVLQTSGYRWPKSPAARVNARMLTGTGIGWVHGDQHQRHRKIMNPAFSVPQLKSFVPLFLRYANKLVKKWKEEEIAPAKDGKPTFNVHKWLSRATLDVIGDAGFGFQFGSLDDSKNELSAVYDNLFVDSTLYPHGWDIVMRSLYRFLPQSVLYWVRYLPSREYQRFRHYQDFVRAFGRNLVARAQKDETGTAKDVMSVLVRANEATDAGSKLSEDEVVDQISTILLAGHDTTASTLTWWLWELARHKDWQDRVREEIRAARRKLAERGDDEFSLADLEGMAAMHATLKEGMRLHPIAWFLFRVAGQDDVIPLSTPITTESGEQISSIPVSKGQGVHISISSYNRNPDAWGEDADNWNPERFLRADKVGMTAVGLFANLLNFSAGIRGCIGWRFSTLEMQAIAATLIENFEFSLPPQTEDNIIKRKPMDLMAPMAKGHPGVWMGLKVECCK